MSGASRPEAVAAHAPASIRWPALVLLLLALLVGLTVAIQTYVTSRVQFGADFHTFWLGARAMFLAGVSPFDPQVTLDTQLGVYGRPAAPGEDPLGFAYPPYSLFAVLPTIWMSYPWAQAFWIALNFTLLMAAIYLAFPGLPPWMLATGLFFYPAGYGMIIGNFALMIGSLFLIIYALLRQPTTPRQALSGALLAWLTIKPQLTWLLVIFFLLNGWRRNQRSLLAAFGLSLLVFFLLAWWLVPGWPAGWVGQVLANADEIQFAEPLALTYAGWLLPDRLAFASAALLTLAVGAMVVRAIRLWWRGSAPDLQPLAWIVLLTQLVHPLILSPDQVIILLPLLLWAWQYGYAARRARGWVWAVAVVVPWLLFFGPLLLWADFELTKSAVTKGPPFLFALWVLWVTFEMPRR